MLIFFSILFGVCCGVCCGFCYLTHKKAARTQEALKATKDILNAFSDRHKESDKRFDDLEHKMSLLKEERDIYMKEQERFFNGISNIMNFDGSPQRKDGDF